MDDKPTMKWSYNLAACSMQHGQRKGVRVSVPSGCGCRAGGSPSPSQPHCWGGGTPSGSPGTAQARPEMVEAGRGAAAQEGQEMGGAQGTGAEELFTSTKHILGSSCRKDVRAGARIQRAFVLCVSEMIARRSTGFHIFPHLFLIC